MSKIELIQVIGKRWFQRSYGNTYHISKIHVTYADGTSATFTTEKQYGYGEQYVQSAHELLVSQSIIPAPEQYGNGSCDSLRIQCERMGIGFSYSVIDVPRERDLKF
jgi:hypothetical protein